MRNLNGYAEERAKKIMADILKENFAVIRFGSILTVEEFVKKNMQN